MEFNSESDPNLWLEDLKDPKVIAWVTERDAKARKTLKAISESLKPRIKRYYDIPLTYDFKATERGEFSLSREKGSYKVNLRAKDGTVGELLCSRELGQDVLIKGLYANLDGSRYAVNYSFGGSDKGFTDVMDTNSNKLLDRLEGITGFFTWVNDETFYYVRYFRDEESPDGVKPPSCRVYMKKGDEDEMVYSEGVPTSHWFSLKGSLEGKKALLSLSYGWHRSSVHTGDLTDPETWGKKFGGGDFKAFPIDYVGNRLYLVSFDGSGWGRILYLDASDNIHKIVNETNMPLQDVVMTQNRIIVNYLSNASSFIRIYDHEGILTREERFTVPGSIDLMTSDGTNCFFRYQSFMIPHRIYKMNDHEFTVISSEEIPGRYAVEEHWSTSKDGTKVHSFIVHKENFEGSKALVYGYGGFSIALTPRFFPNLIPLIEDGGFFIQTNLRGGTEFGEAWHRAGMREKKQNVFDDFISVIEDVKKKELRVVAYGRSNGGLLVGATITQRPNLLDGAIIGYPVLDMRRFHILLTGRSWVPEYGDPDNAKDAKFLSRYSPYHNVKEGASYPPILLFTGLHDDRVHPAHAFKFTFHLEKAGYHPLLRVEMKSGHAGATPETKVNEESDMLAFAYNALGINP